METTLAEAQVANTTRSDLLLLMCDLERSDAKEFDAAVRQFVTRSWTLPEDTQDSHAQPLSRLAKVAQR